MTTAFAGETETGVYSAIRCIAVIGAGVAGRSFALACAAVGFDVVLEDVMPERLRRAQDAYADLLAQPGVGSLRAVLTVEDAVREADLAIDFVPDELESKLEIFSMADRMAPPKTVLVTPSEALSITDLASCTYRGDRCFAVRGNLPAGPITLIHPPETPASTIAVVVAFLRTLANNVQVQLDSDAPMLVKNLSK